MTRLGQHFLTSAGAIVAITEAAALESSDTVLEIGPGHGVLTQALLERSRSVIAIEKDPQLAVFLQIKFENEIRNGHLKLIKADIRDVMKDSLKEETLPTKEQNYKLVANIPYYLTGQIIRHYLSTSHKPKLMVLLVQQEVAERIVSTDHSILSLSVEAYGQAMIKKKVPAGSFSPPPKVDSAILLIDNISDSKFRQHQVSEEFFFTLLRAGFAHKRKFLSSNLKNLPGLETAAVEQAMKNTGLDQNIRAEEVDLEGWFKLAQSLKT